MNYEEPDKNLIEIIKVKSLLKQKVFDNTLNAYKDLKSVQERLAKNYNEALGPVDARVKLQFSPRGEFENELKVAGDLLIFSMHSNIFEFNREHHIWNLPYVKNNVLNSYCGIINIYNFLSDSFKYNRVNDLGYLISRIFINHENHFFVEGKRQSDFSFKNFHNQVITDENLATVVHRSIQYSLEFDLLVPPYDEVKIASVAQMHQKIVDSKMKTGKRLGFRFNSDDVSE
ncbi:MAG: hypothetical protein ACLFNJ_04890 [Bacteroidales bacterium]